jgi:hypothetical protein
MQSQQYGFKMVTLENLLDPDPVMKLFWQRSPDGNFSQMGPKDWAAPILSFDLSDLVPRVVREAFYFTRNAMCYAYWYYPLLTIGCQQILRVADFATEIAATENGLKPARSFARRIEQLLKAGIIPQAEGRWEGIRRLRNSATHPEFQQNWGGGMSIEMIQTTAALINGLKWRGEVTEEEQDSMR